MQASQPASQPGQAKQRSAPSKDKHQDKDARTVAALGAVVDGEGPHTEADDTELVLVGRVELFFFRGRGGDVSSDGETHVHTHTHTHTPMPPAHATRSGAPALR